MAGENIVNKRLQGGAVWEIGGQLNYTSGGYSGATLITHSTANSVLVPGAMNVLAGTSVFTVVLPDPVAGMRLQVINAAASTGQYTIEASSTNLGVDRVIGSATEAGAFTADNSMLLSSGGCIHELEAINTSQWIILSNVGASACSTEAGSSA